MKTFKEFLAEEKEFDDVKIGDKLTLHHKSGKNTKDKGEVEVTKVTANHFHINKKDDSGGDMKMTKHGYGVDFTKSSSSRVKGVSFSSGHYVKKSNSANEEAIVESAELDLTIHPDKGNHTPK